jgi:hypothetical protein
MTACISGPRQKRNPGAAVPSKAPLPDFGAFNVELLQGGYCIVAELGGGASAFCWTDGASLACTRTCGFSRCPPRSPSPVSPSTCASAGGGAAAPAAGVGGGEFLGGRLGVTATCPCPFPRARACSRPSCRP